MKLIPHRLRLAICVCLALAGIGPLAAQEADKQKQALELIIKGVEGICKDLPRTASESKVTLTASGVAELQGLVKKLAKLGISGAAGYTSTESVRGLLEADMLPALADQNKCRIHVFDKLEEKLLSAAPATSKKVSLHCVYPKPYDQQWWVDWDDADRSYLAIDGKRIPDRHPDPNQDSTRTILEHGETRVAWCVNREGKPYACNTINRISGKIFLGMPQATPEAVGDCKPYTPQPTATKF